jgi:hypothetical protein
MSGVSSVIGQGSPQPLSLSLSLSNKINSLKPLRKSSSETITECPETIEKRCSQTAPTTPNDPGILEVEVMEITEKEKNEGLLNEWRVWLRGAVAKSLRSESHMHMSSKNDGDCDSRQSSRPGTGSGIGTGTVSCSDFNRNSMQGSHEVSRSESGRGPISSLGVGAGTGVVIGAGAGIGVGTGVGVGVGEGGKVPILEDSTNLTVTLCLKQILARLVSVSTDLSDDVRAYSADRDLEVQTHLTAILAGKFSLGLGVATETVDGGEGAGGGGGGGGGGNGVEGEQKVEPKLFGVSLRAKSVLDAKAVSLSQTPLFINPNDILNRAKIIFSGTENLCTIATSLIEFLTPREDTPGFSENAPQVLQTAKELKKFLTFLIATCCTAIESVCTALYVLPTPFTVSFKNWAETVNCLLDCRSACVHVLAVCLNYNCHVRTYVQKSSDILETLGQHSRKGVSKSCVASLSALQRALADMEDVIAEEVRGTERGGVE